MAFLLVIIWFGGKGGGEVGGYTVCASVLDARFLSHWLERVAVPCLVRKELSGEHRAVRFIAAWLGVCLLP